MTPWVLDATGCMSSFKFVIPAIPQARPALPVGDRWIHEPKLDGWRLQAHKFGSRVVLFTRSGIDCSLRFPTVVGAVASLPASSAVLDGELVVVGPDGLPDFRAMHRGQAGGLQFFAFDLLHLDGTDCREEPAGNRRVLLEAQLKLYGRPLVRLVEAFADGPKLLNSCEAMGMEGVVSKRHDAPYRSGTRCGWVKVKKTQRHAIVDSNSLRASTYKRGRSHRELQRGTPWRTL